MELKEYKQKFKKFVKKLNKRNKKLLFLFFFLLGFLILAFPLYLIEFMHIDLFGFEMLVTQQVSLLLKASGIEHMINVVLYKTYTIPAIQIPNIPVIAIDIACTGIRSMFAFIALVFALPLVDKKKRFKALIWGLPTIYIVNILRIYTTILVGLSISTKALDIVHTILWREGLVLLIIVMWIYWIKHEKIKLTF